MATIQIDNEFLNKLMTVSEKAGIEYDVYEGSLNNNAIFYNTKDIKIKGIARTKYLLVKEKYLNTWSSELLLITTDSLKKVEQFRNELEGIEVI